MIETRIYTKEITTCAECPARVMQRAGVWQDWQTKCKHLNRVVTKAAREGRIDPRCPLAKKEDIDGR